MADQVIGVNCGFFDAVDNDRVYSADDMNKPYSHFISDGIFATPTGTVISATNDYVNMVSGNNAYIHNPVEARVPGLNIYGKTIVPDKYRIKIKTEDQSTYTTVANNITDLEYLINSLEDETKYNIKIDVHANSKWYDNAIIVSVKPRAVLENAPVVMTTAQNGQVVLSWDAITGASKYYVARVNNDGTYTALDPEHTTTTYYDSNLENGQEYTYLVQARVGNSWYPSGASNLPKYYVYATPNAGDIYAPYSISVKPYSSQADVSWLWKNSIDDPLTLKIKTDNTNTASLPLSTQLPLRGKQVTGNDDYTYIDSRGEYWLADEIDCAAGVVIKRLDENLNPITPLKYSLSSTELSNFSHFKTNYGDDAYIYGSQGVYFDMQYIKKIIAEQDLNDLTAVSDFKVSGSNNLKVLVAPGRGLFAQKWLESLTTLTISVPSNTNAYDRIDSVIIQVDKRASGRSGNIVYRTGSAAREPDPPEINTINEVTEYRVANIRVASGAVKILQSAITDCRGTPECPWATSQIYQGNVAALTSRILAAEEKVASGQAEITGVKADVESLQDQTADLSYDLQMAEEDITDLQAIVADTGWIDLTATGSWTAGTPAPKVRAFGKVVNIIGEINAKSLNLITTLPAKCRPLYGYQYTARLVLEKTGIPDADGLAIINIGTDGVVTIEDYVVLTPSSTAPYTNYKIRLDTVFTAQ